MTGRIRIAELSELPAILEVYAEARSFMAENGNPTQWGVTGYPQEELLREDIELKRLYVILHGERVAGAFVLAFGDEPTYRVIENGAWPNERPYATIHRLGSRRDEHGVAEECLDFCAAVCRERGLALRADTHENNLPMRHILEKYGFDYCGVITVTDCTERLAYQMEI